MRLLRSFGRSFLHITAVAAAVAASSMVTSAQGVAPMKPALLPADAVDLGPLPGAQTVSLTLHLAPSAAHEAALEQFVAEVQTTGSSSWHRWVTPAEFAASFGPDASAVAAVRSFAENAGLARGGVAVSASGTRMTLSGTVTQVEAAFAPSLHAYAETSTGTFHANAAAVRIPAALQPYVLAIDGLSDAPGPAAGSVGADGVVSPSRDVLQALTAAVEANIARVLTVETAACVEDFDSGSLAAMRLVLRQAAAQGITVLASSGCGARGTAGVPSIFTDATAVAQGSGLTLTGEALASGDASELRPSWQQADGLPADALRHEPDATVSSLAALAATMQQILAREPANPDGTAARLGNIAPELYALRSVAGLYTQPDDATAARTGSATVASAGTSGSGTAASKWEPATGLGVVSLTALAKAFPAGTASNNVQLTLSNPGATHGQNITFTANVTNISGIASLPAPTGTVSFVLNTGATVGTGTLTGGTYSVTTNTLSAGSYTVVAQYSGDANYAAANSVTDSLSVAPEASVISAVAQNSTPVGGTLSIVVTDTSTSGIGTPTGTVTVIPQFLSSPPTYTATLSGASGTSSATVAVPATQAGSLVFKANCVSTDPSFTCYNPVNLTATVTQGTPTVSLSVSPNPPVSGQTVQLQATVSGAGSGFATPTGNVTFYDNGVSIGTAALSGNVASFTTGTLSSSSHSFTATYNGDNNYAQASSTTTPLGGTSTTTTSITSSVSTLTPGGSVQLSAVVSPSSIINGKAPSGTITFVSSLQGTLGSVAVSGNMATLTVSLTTNGAHSITAIYSGDGNYKNSTSNGTTVTVGPASAVTIAVTPTTAAYGTGVTLSASATGTPNSGTGPTGTVNLTLYGTVTTTATISLTPTSTTTATGTTTLTAPTPGTYLIQATCTGTNFNCTGVTIAQVQLTTTKATSTTTLTSTPAAPTAGQAVTYTATVASGTANQTATASAPTGTVTFSLNGASAATVTLTGTTATWATTAVASATVTAAYNGDSNYAASNSTTTGGTTTPTPPPPVPTTTVISASGSSGLASTGVLFTAVVTDAPTTANPTPGAPVGTVTFYDSHNGQMVSLGTVTLVTTGQYTATAQVSTTALGAGSHSITAVFSGGTNTNGSTSAGIALSLADYALTFSPSSLTLARGKSGSSTITVSAVNGFTGTVAMHCTAPSGSLTTCSVTPSAVSGSGTATVVITTQQGAAQSGGLRASLERVGGSGIMAAGMVLLFLLPGVRRRRPTIVGILAILMASAAVLCATGCTTLTGTSGSSGFGSGTPTGTLSFTISTTGTQNGASVNHDAQFLVTVQ